MRRSFLFLLLGCIAIAGCDDGAQPTSSVSTADLYLATTVDLTLDGLSIHVDVRHSGSELRLSSGDHLYAYINGNRYGLIEEYYTLPYTTDLFYYYTLNLPVVAGGTVVRVALERDNGTSASNNTVTIPLMPTITNPPANTTLSYAQDQYFSWLPGWSDDDSLSLILLYCCFDSYFSVDVTSTEYVIPAGTMYLRSDPFETTMTVTRRRSGTVDGNLKGGSIYARAISSQVVWIHN